MIALPLLVVGGVVAAVRPRLRRKARRDRSATTGGPVARVAPFVVLGLVFGVSFAITGDTTGVAVSFGAVALLVLAVVVERWRLRRAVGG
jgi:hypothetical protein